MGRIFKLEFYVPEDHLEKVKDALFSVGAGAIGDYECCCWQTKGTGQFRPGEGSNPYIGVSGEIETVSEYKVELICKEEIIEQVIDALKTSHPYETPAYAYWEIHS